MSHLGYPGGILHCHLYKYTLNIVWCEEAYNVDIFSGCLSYSIEPIFVESVGYYCLDVKSGSVFCWIVQRIPGYYIITRFIWLHRWVDEQNFCSPKPEQYIILSFALGRWRTTWRGRPRRRSRKSCKYQCSVIHSSWFDFLLAVSICINW